MYTTRRPCMTRRVLQQKRTYWRWSGCTHDENTVVRFHRFGRNLWLHFWCKTPDTLVTLMCSAAKFLSVHLSTKMRTWCSFFWKETAVNDKMISSDGIFLTSCRFNSQMGPLFSFSAFTEDIYVYFLSNLGSETTVTENYQKANSFFAKLQNLPQILHLGQILRLKFWWIPVLILNFKCSQITVLKFYFFVLRPWKKDGEETVVDSH